MPRHRVELTINATSVSKAVPPRQVVIENDDLSVVYAKMGVALQTFAQHYLLFPDQVQYSATWTEKE